MELANLAKKVLICDDEEFILRLIERGLERQGYEVEAVVSGKDALTSIQRHIPDVVVLDAVLADMDGFDVLKAIRKDPLCESTFVIMLLESVDDEMVVKVFSLGADIFFTKGKDFDGFFNFFRH